MKKTVALLLIVVLCVSVCSCTEIIDWELNRHAVALADEAIKVSTYNDYYKDDGYRAFVDKITVFSAKLTDKLISKYGDSENIVISPLSVYMALALACECANGETRQEILDAVGVTYNEVSAYTKKLYSFGNVKYSQPNIVGVQEVVARQELFNSIWLDDSVAFVREGVDRLASEYHCDVYQTSFKSGEAGKLINRYIESKSHGLLEGDVNFDTETYFVLMNTYYLKEIWNEYGDHLEFTGDNYKFINTDGSVKETKLLKGYYNDGRAYHGNGFSSFYTKTDHGFGIYFFLPENGNSAQGIFNEENISAVLTLKEWGHIDDENRQIHYTRVLFPEFEVDFSRDIASVLKADLGINLLFDPELCNMSNVTEESVCCDGVIHKAALKVDKTGIEGAAVTVLPMAGAAAPPDYEKVYHDFEVINAFGFVITDSCGTIVFSGLVNTLQ